jgi:hypothetical protein
MKQGKNRDHPPRMAGKAKRAESDRAEKFSAVWRDNLFSKRRNSPDGSNFAFVRNPAGIRIKVYCASCAWKVLTESLVTRKCRIARRRRVKTLSRSR